MCFAVIEGFARSSNDVQVKRMWIFAYRIKTRLAFPPRGQLQVEAMVWPVWIKVSLMQHLNFKMFCTFVSKQRHGTFVVRLFWTNEKFPRVSFCYWKLAKGRWMLAAAVIACLCFRKMMHSVLAICLISFLSILDLWHCIQFLKKNCFNTASMCRRDAASYRRAQLSMPSNADIFPVFERIV